MLDKASLDHLLAELNCPDPKVSGHQIAPVLSLLHEAPVCLARFDRVLSTWLSNHAMPGGVVLFDRSEAMGAKFAPLPYPTALVDASDDSDVQAAAAAKASPPPDRLKQPFFLLESNDCATASDDDSARAHFQPLIPAPDLLLQGPQHPCYPMQPSLWVPFAPSLKNEYYATPYHRGIFGTACHPCVLGVGRPLERSGDAHSMWDVKSGPAFNGMVHWGSVVSYKLVKNGPVVDGVVVFTAVRMSESISKGWRHVVVSQPRILELLEHKTPWPYVLVVPLQKEEGCASKDDDPQRPCWQGGPAGKELVQIGTDQITRVFCSSELGAAGKSAERAVVMHVDALTSKAVKLPSSSGSAIRNLATNHLVRTAVVNHILEASQRSGCGGATFNQFLLELREKASLQYPVDALLAARARMNHAQPMRRPGLLQQLLNEEQREAREGMQQPREPSSVQKSAKKINAELKRTQQIREAEAEDVSDCEMQDAADEASVTSSRRGTPKRAVAAQTQQRVRQTLKREQQTDANALAPVPRQQSRSKKGSTAVVALPNFARRTEQQESDGAGAASEGDGAGHASSKTVPAGRGNRRRAAPSGAARASRSSGSAAAGASRSTASPAAGASSSAAAAADGEGDPSEPEAEPDDNAEDVPGRFAVDASTHELFIALSNVHNAEDTAPLAGWIFNQFLMERQEQNKTALPTDRELADGMESWLVEVWSQLAPDESDKEPSIDPEFLEWLTKEASGSHSVQETARKLADPNWRTETSTKGADPKSKGKKGLAPTPIPRRVMPWFYHEGKCPAAADCPSVWEAHQRDVQAERGNRKLTAAKRSPAKSAKVKRAPLAKGPTV